MVAAPRPRPGPGLLLGRPGEGGPEDRLQCEDRLGPSSEEEPGPTASDIADLPFSMPKLARRLAAAPGPGLIHPKRPSSGLELGFSGAVAAGGPATWQEPSAKYCRQARPRSLGEPPPGALGLALPLHRPGLPPESRPGSPPARRKPLLFLAPASLDLSSSQPVDTALPLESQEWYHGILSRVEAESVLRPHTEGSYLVRAGLQEAGRTGRTPGGNDKMDYSLAIKSSRGFMHLRIQRDLDFSGAFRLAQFDRHFQSVVSMVHHYSINRLPIRGAEHMCLLTPVTEELL